MKQLSWFLLIFVMTALVITGCNKEDEPDPVPDTSAYDNADLSKGGIMYDKFWSTEAGYDQNNQYYATLSENGDFFRCKQCHGWDGLGTTGAYINRAPKTTRPNVNSLNLYQIAQSKTPQELFDAMKATNGRRDISYDLSAYNPETNADEGDKMPNFTQLLTDAQIWDVVKFMKDGIFDVSQLYDATTTGTYPAGSYTLSNIGKDGNAANGKAYYAANCAQCHGADGTNFELEGKTVGDFTRSKAYEVQHKVKYGQLGSTMVGEFDITLNQMKDLYKALADETAFPDEPTGNSPVSMGGIMYDKFWSTEAGYDQNHQYYTTLSENGDFFRCKQCHGWDGLGSAGAYINRAPKTTRPNVNSLNLYQTAQLKTEQELFDAMKATNGRRDISYDLSTYDPETNATEGDKMPNYNQLLTDEQIWNIVIFMKQGMFDVSELYDAVYTGSYPTGSYALSNIGKNGNADNGNTFYASNCAQCHGEDGTAIGLEGKTVGDFTRSKAYEVQHKVKYGQLGSSMVGEFQIEIDQMKDLYKALADESNFPD